MIKGAWDKMMKQANVKVVTLASQQIEIDKLRKEVALLKGVIAAYDRLAMKHKNIKPNKVAFDMLFMGGR